MCWALPEQNIVVVVPGRLPIYSFCAPKIVYREGSLVPVAGGNRDLPPGCGWSGWPRSWLPVWSRLGPRGWPRSWEGGWSRLPGETRTCPPALVVRLVSVACHASLQSWRCMGHKYTQWARDAATPTQMHSLCSLIEVKVARGNHDQMAYNRGCAC